ncbi:hypothetical protein GCM10025868_39260 [Angustibacter aerolatus]|uniref:Uncharacterized protein n=1 Tax=Angustibacter aerolatus TaxID=1162965 RepID=A0ABQ6JK79_9ACTN|nr:hypothetical protein GCM10025868_39260 [Angustibacter aerolatus]
MPRPSGRCATTRSLLQTGTSGGTDFADDVVVDQVRGESAKQRKGVEKVARYRQTHAASDDDLEVVRTADGGALLVGVIERHDVFTVRKGAGTIKPPRRTRRSPTASLQQIRKKADVTTVQMVAMVLPPKGAGDARVVGFSEPADEGHRLLTARARVRGSRP